MTVEVDGHRVRLDVDGSPDGPTVVYLHGTPDSRLARPGEVPDGVRLLAPDRPGYGGTDPFRSGDPHLRVRELASVLDGLIDRYGSPGPVGVMGWSTGALWARAVAGHMRHAPGAMVLVAPVPDAAAYRDPVVRAALPPDRRNLVEAAAELGASEAARAMAPLVAPVGMDLSLAREWCREQEPDGDPAVADRLARAVADGMAVSTAGVEADLLAQVTPGLVDVHAGCPVLVVSGRADRTVPPALAAWVARTDDAVHLVTGGGHRLLFDVWDGVLGWLNDRLVPGDRGKGGVGSAAAGGGAAG